MSPYQNTFIKGRSISNNIMLGSEIIDAIRKKKGEKGTLGALKLDMDKAYDRIHQGFIKVVMECMGFNNHWIKLIH